MRRGQSCGLSFVQQVRQTHQLAQSLRLSQQQRQEIQGYMFTLRMDLVNALRGERYVPRATCPRCARKLTPVEIISGFNQDPNDFTTCCTACAHRFEPNLICFDGKAGHIELPFYCGSQALAQLKGKETLAPEQFARKHPAVYRSLVVHYGGVRRAFEKIGIQYPYREVYDWKHKISPFLGRLPDTIIAECVDVSAHTIRRLRNKLGVEPHTMRKTAIAAGIDA